MKGIKSFLKSARAAVVKTLKTKLERWLVRFLTLQGAILYAAHTGAESLTGTVYAISAALPTTYDAAGYGATTMAYTTIGEVETFMTYGSTRSVQKFTPINGPIEKLKGSPDYGDGDMVFANVPADAGQVILKAAEASPNHYSLKVTYSDGEVHYLDVLVSSFKYSGGGSGAVLTVTATLGICRQPVIVAAT